MNIKKNKNILLFLPIKNMMKNAVFVDTHRDTWKSLLLNLTQQHMVFFLCHPHFPEAFNDSLQVFQTCKHILAFKQKAKQ